MRLHTPAATERVRSTVSMTILGSLLLASALATPAPAEAAVGQGRGPVAAERDDRADIAPDPFRVWRELLVSFYPQSAAQVRIEQRVILRIGPRTGGTREALTSLAPSGPPPIRLEERAMDDCVPISAIAAVQPRGDSRLLLFLRDRKLIAADLERSCSARDFYSGFYVERASDGRMCIDRDRVHARNGAKCRFSRFHRLVAVEQ